MPRVGLREQVGPRLSRKPKIPPMPLTNSCSTNPRRSRSSSTATGNGPAITLQTWSAAAEILGVQRPNAHSPERASRAAGRKPGTSRSWCRPAQRPIEAIDPGGCRRQGRSVTPAGGSMLTTRVNWSPRATRSRWRCAMEWPTFSQRIVRSSDDSSNLSTQEATGGTTQHRRAQ